MGLGLSLGVAQTAGVAAPSLPVVEVSGPAPRLTETSTDSQVLSWSFSGSVTPANALIRSQWMRDGMPIAGASGQSYAVTAEDGGAEITVQLVFSASGFAPYALNTNAIAIAQMGWAFVGDIIRVTPAIPAPPRVRGSFVEA